MPQSGLTGYYFPYVRAMNGYSDSTYNPSYSDGVISPNDISRFVGDVNALPDTRIPNFCGLLVCICAWPFTMVGTLLFVTLNTQRQVYTCPTYGPCYYVTKGIFNPNTIWLPIVLTILLHIGFFITVLMILVKKANAWRLRRNTAINACINHHMNTTFSGKNVIVRLSNHGSYIAIEFKWRFNSAPGMPVQSAGGYNQPFAPQQHYQAGPVFAGALPTTPGGGYTSMGDSNPFSDRGHYNQPNPNLYQAPPVFQS